jgi:hypothetical protein
LFERLLLQATWLVPWGIIGFAILVLALAALGLHARSRWIAGFILCLVACVSVAIIGLMSTSAMSVGELLFLLPCVVVAIFGAWLAVVERRGGQARSKCRLTAQ